LDVPVEQEEEDQPLSELIDKELKVRRKPTVKEKEVYIPFQLSKALQLILHPPSSGCTNFENATLSTLHRKIKYHIWVEQEMWIAGRHGGL